MSEVKNIPRLRFPEFEVNWSLKKLNQVGRFIGGGTPDRTNLTYWDGEIPWISSSDIIEDNINSIYLNQTITHEGLSNSATKIIPKNSVIIVSRVGIGKFAINKVELCTSQDFTNLIPNEDNSYFLGYQFEKLKNKFISLGQGTSIKGFTTNDLKLFKVHIPSLPEQQKIADFLTAVDKRIELLEKKKTLLETYKKGVMKKIFNQEIRFKDDNGNEFPDWEKKRLGELSPKMKSGGTPKSTIKDYYDGDIPFLSIGDMTSQNKYLNWTSKTISKRGLENSSSWVVPKNSIIYSMYASVGFVSINKIDLSISQAVMAIQPVDEMNLEFLYYSLLNFQPKIKSLIETGTQGNINGGIVKNIQIDIPTLNE